MRVSTNFAPPLSAVLFGLLLVSRAALAATADCPVEPASNFPIADGEVLAGPNCTLNNVGDIDSFVFNGATGDTYHLALAQSGVDQNICLTLYDPNGKQIFSACTGGFEQPPSVVDNQMLTTTGSYTMVITETSTGTQNYAVSIERVYPFPPNAQPGKLATVYPGDITPLTDSNAFIFEGATTGMYRVTASLAANSSQNLCMTVYSPGGSALPGGSCTGGFEQPPYIQFDFTPSQGGTYMAFLTEAGNDGTVSYTLEVSCLEGKCPSGPPPSCALTDTLSYTSGTLTMNFTVENTYATTWNIWLTDQNTMQLLYSASQQITDSPTPITKTTPLAPEGKVGILSTLTTPTNGITCSSWAQIQTGAP